MQSKGEASSTGRPSVPGLTAPEVAPFNGTPEDCQNFIIRIRRHALSQARSRDDAWTADLAACCLDGAAIQWHLDLPTDVASSWAELQRALLERYVMRESTSSVPTPQSPLPPRYEATIQSSPGFRNDAIHGVIAVQSAGLSSTCYIGFELNKWGRIYVTNDPDQAMRLRYVPRGEPSRLQIQHAMQYTLLVLARNLEEASEDIWADDVFHIAPAYVSQGAHERLTTSLKFGVGPRKSDVWSIMGENNALQATWNGIDLVPLISVSASPRAPGSDANAGIRLVVDPETYIDRYPISDRTYFQAKLTFKSVTSCVDRAARMSVS